MEMISWVGTHLPFAALVTGKAPENRPMLTRLADQAIVGVVAAIFAIWANNIRQEDRITQLTQSVTQLTATVEMMRHDLYQPIAKAQK